MLSLKLFSVQQAREVIATLADAAGLTLESGLVDDLLAGMRREEQRISATDIGITLMALNELALRKSTKQLSKGDYRIAGGSTGLLTDYISNHLARYRQDEREAILKILRGLADLGKNQRLAEGLDSTALAEKVNLSSQLLQRYLKDLSSPHVRLLEKLENGNYRLPHERLIPALRQVSGLMLAEADQAGLELNKSYRVWEDSERNRKFLLSGKTLSTVVKNSDTLFWGEAKAEKEIFLRVSLQARRFRNVVLVMLLLFTIGLGITGNNFYDAYRYREALRDWQLPENLYGYQSQLKTLKVENQRLTHLRWLQNGLAELSISSSALSQLDNLDKLSSLTALTLDLGRSRIATLEPLKDLKNLTTMRLALQHTKVQSIYFLRALDSLESLIIVHDTLYELGALPKKLVHIELLEG